MTQKGCSGLSLWPEGIVSTWSWKELSALQGGSASAWCCLSALWEDGWQARAPSIINNFSLSKPIRKNERRSQEAFFSFERLYEWKWELEEKGFLEVQRAAILLFPKVVLSMLDSRACCTGHRASGFSSSRTRCCHSVPGQLCRL